MIPTFLHFLSFLSVISLFKMAPKCGAEVLSIVPKCRKAVMCLMGCELGKFHSCMSYGAVGVSSVLMNQQYGTSRKRKFTDVYASKFWKVLK